MEKISFYTLPLMYLSLLYLLAPFSLIYFLRWQQQASVLFSQAQITYISAAQPTLILVSHTCFKYRLVLLPPKYCSPWRFLYLISQSGALKGSLTSPSPLYSVSQEGTLPPPTTLLLQQSSSSHMGDSTNLPTHLCALCTHRFNRTLVPEANGFKGSN